MEREEVENVSSEGAQLALWLTGDIELETLEVLTFVANMLELVLDALTKLNRRIPRP